MSRGLNPFNRLFLFVALSRTPVAILTRPQGIAGTDGSFSNCTDANHCGLIRAIKPHFTDAATMGTLYLKMQG